jgi:hypothetical protein
MTDSPTTSKVSVANTHSAEGLTTLFDSTKEKANKGDVGALASVVRPFFLENKVQPHLN